MTGRAKIAIAVGGSAVGHLLLLGGAVGWIAIGGVPENDDFSLRTKLGSEKKVEVLGSNYAASRERGEPLHAEVGIQSGSVWWSWRSPEEVKDVLIEVELQGGEPLVGVYLGFAVDKLERIAASENGTVSFVPQPNVDYHIAVAGSDWDDEGVIALRISGFTNEDSESSQPEEEEATIPEIVIEEPELEPEKKSFEYMRTTQNDPALKAPEDAKFESDRNTIAASALAAVEGGLEDMPSQEGEKLPFMEMADREFSDGELGDDATIPIAAMEVVMPMVSPEERRDPIEFREPGEESVVEAEVEATSPLASTAPELLEGEADAEAGEFVAEVVGEKMAEGEGEGSEQAPAEEVKEKLAEVRPPQKEVIEQLEAPAPTPAPEMAVGVEKAKQENVFQPETRRNQVAGTISNRGETGAVDAAETPLGSYTRQVTGAVEKRWHFERRRKSDFATYGSLKVSFVIGVDGKAGNLKILENNANPIMTDFTLGAILNADVPPMPKEVRDLLGTEPLEITYDVIIY